MCVDNNSVLGGEQMTMTICPRCKGNKVLVIQNGNEWDEMYCPLCDGEGFIEKEKLERIKNAKTDCACDRGDA